MQNAIVTLREKELDSGFYLWIRYVPDQNYSVWSNWFKSLNAMLDDLIHIIKYDRFFMNHWVSVLTAMQPQIFYQEDMEEEDAKRLVQDAIRAGIFNDLGSGSNVDLCVIRKNSVEMLRNMEKPNEQSELRASITRPKARDFSHGTTPVLSTTVIPHITIETETVAVGAESKTE